MNRIKYLSSRISYQQKENGFSIVITGKTERWKEAALMAWVLAWTASGIYFIYQLSQDLPRETKMGIFIFLFFWLYFEVRVGRALMWRLWGFEQIRFTPGQMSVKRNIKGYGKRVDYFLQNIAEFNKVEVAPHSLMASMENSFWVVGGERIYFEHLGKKVGLGMQLSEVETNQLLQLIRKQAPRFRK